MGFLFVSKDQPGLGDVVAQAVGQHDNDIFAALAAKRCSGSGKQDLLSQTVYKRPGRLQAD